MLATKGDQTLRRKDLYIKSVQISCVESNTHTVFKQEKLIRSARDRVGEVISNLEPPLRSKNQAKCHNEKEFATKTLLVMTPLRSIRLSERVVRVVPNVPKASIDHLGHQWLASVRKECHTPAPTLFALPAPDERVYFVSRRL